MEIRRAREDEAAALSAIARASKAHWPYQAEQIEVWRDDLAISRDQIVATPVFVAEIDGGITGFFQLLPQGETWVLEHLWVLPEHMGKGLGKALLQYAVDFACESGAHRISIDADPHAEAFYRACGARTLSAVAAPIPGELQRVRPQMILGIKTPRVAAYLHLLPGSPMPACPLRYPFKAVLISDAQAANDWKEQVCNWLVQSGCLYAMTWGVDCESWHDFVDLANLDKFEFGDIPESHFIMTTWHEKDLLHEVFDFSKRVAMHPSVETPDTLILHIAATAREEEVRAQYSLA